MVPKVRRWTRSHAALLLVGLSAALSASGCLSDVSVPACFVDDSCGDGGAGGDGEIPGPLAGTSSGGTTQPQGGSGGSGANGGTMPVMPNGGAAGGEDTETMGGMAGAGGETECGDCVILPGRLLPPCAGSSYEAPLSVHGGEAPYRWQLMPGLANASITVDPDHTARAVLNIPNVGEGDIELTVKVIDGNGLQQSSTYSLKPRTACLFAFTALGEQGPELRLLDPFVPEPTPVALEHNQGVYDFNFSPDGTHLAYRFGASEAIPQGAHLAVVDLKTFDEQVLSFAEDRIKAFAWSPDSSKLAVAFVVGGSTYLAAAPVSGPGTAAALDAFGTIQAFVESDLYWVGNSFVAYHAARIPDFAHPGQFLEGADNPFNHHTAFYSELGPNGFGKQAWTLDTFPANVVLQPTNGGFFMVTGDEPGTIFTPLPGNGFVGVHASTSLVSPSGKYSALLDDDSRLQVLTAEGGIDVAPVATAMVGEACPMPLAWAKGVERIACLADVPNAGSTSTHGELRIFNLKSQSEELEMLTLGGFCNDDVSSVNAASCTTLEEGYGYGTNQASGAARAFSGSGRWFAFASVFEGRTVLYTADLEVRPPTLTTVSSFTEAGNLRVATRLAFSPDERLLLLHSGRNLRLQDPKTGIMRQVLSVTLAGDQKCSDDFSANPNSYCGNAEPPDALRWAPDSRAFAFRTSGALTVIDATEWTSTRQKLLQAPECAAQCANQFSFQPQLLP
jgi:hypothetical protein